MRSYVLLLALIGCARPAPVARPVAAPPPPPKPAGAAHDFEESARRAGLEVDHCGGSLLVTTPGSRELTPLATARFLTDHRPPPRDEFLTPGIEMSGFGGCSNCSRPTPGGCIKLEMWEDSPALRALPAALAKAVSDDTRVHVEVDILPLPRRRCEHAGECGAVPYDRGDRAPTDRRKVVTRGGKPLNSGGRCAHDGECRFACGCSRYDSRQRICADVYYQELRGAWCGCVEGSCAWFH